MIQRNSAITVLVILSTWLTWKVGTSPIHFPRAIGWIRLNIDHSGQNQTIPYNSNSVYSLVRSLTQEMFNAMTFEEFVEIVDNWLSEKHARIDKYKEYQGLEPVY